MDDSESQIARALNRLADAQDRLAAAAERGNALQAQMVQMQAQNLASTAALEQALLGEKPQ